MGVHSIKYVVLYLDEQYTALITCGHLNAQAGLGKLPVAWCGFENDYVKPVVYAIIK
jgi:hypothetical protein